jgi:hypothetical protein
VHVTLSYARQVPEEAPPPCLWQSSVITCPRAQTGNEHTFHSPEHGPVGILLLLGLASASRHHVLCDLEKRCSSLFSRRHSTICCVQASHEDATPPALTGDTCEALPPESGSAGSLGMGCICMAVSGGGVSAIGKQSFSTAAPLDHAKSQFKIRAVIPLAHDQLAILLSRACELAGLHDCI